MTSSKKESFRKRNINSLEGRAGAYRSSMKKKNTLYISLMLTYQQIRSNAVTRHTKLDGGNSVDN